MGPTITCDNDQLPAPMNADCNFSPTRLAREECTYHLLAQPARGEFCCTICRDSFCFVPVRLLLSDV